MVQETCTISQEENSRLTKGHGEGGNEMKKGPWSTVEDAILLEYVARNGEGNWNSIRKKTGLSRCGKSCRLRWVNHLRSNLKKEAITPEEENTILRLHAKYGNRWSRLAHYLPGRTDNEIKNYWNARHKRHVLAGAPIYPPDVQKIYDQHHHRQQPKQNQIQLSSSSPTNHNPHSSSYDNTVNPHSNFIPFSSSSNLQTNLNFNSLSPSSSSTFQANIDANSIDPMFLIDAVNNTFPNVSSYHHDSMLESNLDIDNNVVVELSPPSSPNLQDLTSHYVPVFYQNQLTPFEINSLPILDASLNDAFLSENFELEIPLVHSTYVQEITPTSSSTNANHHIDIVPLEDNNEGLEDVLRQSNILLSSELPSKEDEQAKDDQFEKRMNHPYIDMNLGSILGQNGDENTHLDDSSSSISLIDMEFTSQDDLFEDIDMLMNVHLWNWLDFPQNEHLQEPNQGSNDASTEPANVYNDNMGATINTIDTNLDERDLYEWIKELMYSPITSIVPDTNHDWAQEVMGSPIAVTPIKQDQDDWAIS